jgi:hypothetical protein
VEDKMYLEKSTDLSQVTDELYRIINNTSPWTRFELTTLVVIGTDCTDTQLPYDHDHDCLWYLWNFLVYF